MFQPYRCPTCGKLLFKSDAPAGQVDAFCRPCGALRTLTLGHAPARPLDARSPRGVESHRIRR